MDLPTSVLEIVMRPLAALACGAVLGFEREVAEKPAGLRTQMLVALGASAFTILTLRLYEELAPDGSGLDPLRIISGVAGGIGFLGAGSIIRGRESVSGVTTAATIWVTGSVGIACGAGWYSIAGIVTLYTLVTLWLIGILERRFQQLRKASSESDQPT
jgi:putative Mg2+ transporter-C (MgtC) family protein